MMAGMYLVYFPQNQMNCFFFFPRPISVGISTYFVLAVWLFFDGIAAAAGVKGVAYVAHILAFLAGIGAASLSLKKNWVAMEKDETSLLQLLQKKPNEETEQPTEHKETTPAERAGTPTKHPSESTVMETPVADGEGFEKPPQAEKPQVDFIRFYCDCGKRIKVPAQYAGKKGRCPQCKSLLRIPSK
jgi:hypothetical protein